MQFKKTIHDFLENKYHLSRYKIAAFSAIVVAVGFFISQQLELGILTAALVIGAQSITGVNRAGSFKIRLGVAFGAAVVISFASLLGAIAGTQIYIFSFLISIVLAFSFGWCRQLFPFNWPDIVIPAGVLFFVNYTHPAVLITISGCIMGLLCELLLGLFIYLKQYFFSTSKVQLSHQEDILPSPEKQDRIIFGLKEFLFIYSIELGLLLCMGFVILHFTSFPHAYWMPLTAIIVLKVGRRETLKRVISRTLGTTLGCLLGSILLYFITPTGIASMSIMVICIFVWICFLRHNYAVGTIFITTYVLLLLGDGHDFSYFIVLERIIFTILGGLSALFISLLFLPKERL